MTTTFKSYQDLAVWKRAMKLTKEVYQVTRNFPADERFGLTNQIRRAAVSVSSNIAEGSGRNSDKDFGHFLEQAYGSLMEVASTFFLALDEGYVSEKELEPLFDELEVLAPCSSHPRSAQFTGTTGESCANALVIGSRDECCLAKA